MSIERELTQLGMQHISLKQLIVIKRELLATTSDEAARAKLQEELKDLSNKEIAMADLIEELRAERRKS